MKKPVRRAAVKKTVALEKVSCPIPAIEAEPLPTTFVGQTICDIRNDFKDWSTWTRARAKLTLQGKALCRSVFDGDKKQASELFGKIVANKLDDAPIALCITLAPIVSGIHILSSHIKDVEKKLNEQVALLPVYDWWISNRGLGPFGLARIIGNIGDPSLYHKRVLGIWKRLGLGLVGNERQRRVGRGTLSAAEHVDLCLQHGYSAQRRSDVWNVGSAFCRLVFADAKANKPLGPYAVLFLQWLEEYRAKLKPGHALACAQRKLEKRLVRDLYRTWVGQSLADGAA